MKCIYFDCFSGISGDMTLGALLDLGVPVKYLREELKRLPISGYHLVVSRVMQHGVACKRVTVNADNRELKRHLRTYMDLERIITKSSLTAHIKDRCLQIFYRIAKAEAGIHGKKISDIHFHEIGAIDTLVDIAGSVIGFDLLGAGAFYSSAVPVGSGFIECEHGTLPVPAPATLALLKNAPVYTSGVCGEMVTPTGAAILTSYVQHFESMPPMKLIKAGYGAGARNLQNRPNMLRLILGEAWAGTEDEKVWVAEANIDDMNPEWIGFLMEKLFAAGALDVVLIPVYMKKNRPGIMLQAICPEENQPQVLQTIFLESTTSGIRYYQAGRVKLQRKQLRLKTKFGILKVKVFSDTQGEYAAPEFEECKKVALKKGIPLRQVYEEVVYAFKKR